ncbi:MAG: tRNA preQ1(34) S-adenosylmethionine ribosyltransferase-isomerase QueA [Acidobacteria bacterium]|nr:tRNA preQ1(34) S-adenosylmethionine ribosyltransferase-isomerase QueA [Acidobacteriota bacterium]
MMTRDFDFVLPDALIAQEPPAVRGDSRLLVLHRESGRVEHTSFSRLSEHVQAGDLLVLNNTRVFPARLLGQRLPAGGAVECLLLRQLPTPQRPTLQLPTPNSQLPISSAATPDSDGAPGRSPLGVGQLGVGHSVVWDALVRPGRKLQPGATIVFEGGGVRLHGEVLTKHLHGRRTIRLWADQGVDVLAAIDRVGHVPLPPYIKRRDRLSDRERYQTVYARERGSIAAPTAGLHFTDTVLESLASRGVEHTELTLHVGYGTFKPIRTDQVEDHVVDPETCIVPAGAAEALTRARRDGRRIIAVGTTSVRALESLTVEEGDRVEPSIGDARLFIRPGHQFRNVHGLITNFHLPQSSLLVLVAAFVGRERILDTYREAVARGYRFYSYGDAMLIL